MSIIGNSLVFSSLNGQYTCKTKKIHFFSIWAGATSSRATKVIDTWKNWFFSQFSEYLNFGRFWPLLTQFWVKDVQRKTPKKVRTEIKVLRFLLKTSQKISKKIEKNVFEKLRKNAVFLCPDHFPTPPELKTTATSKNSQTSKMAKKCAKRAFWGGGNKNHAQFGLCVF